jgi:alpha-glucosidase
VLSNHDTHRHVTRYGSLARARAGTLLMLALPGSAYLYQGEELGLPEVLDLPDAARQDPVFRRSGGADKGRDGCRVPIPWSGDTPPYGFSATGAAWLPSPASWGSLTVAAEDGEPGSTLSLYREALRLRRADSMTGPMTWHESIPTVLDFERRGGLRCVVNAGDEPVPLPEGYGDPVLASGPLAGDRLPADTAAWFTRP